MTGFLRNLMGGDVANDAQVTATNQSVQGQQSALDYLKQREQIPNEIRDQALQGLQSVYNPSGIHSQQDLIDQAMNSPLYKSLMDTRSAGADQIARYASASGQLRSGNFPAALSRDSTRIANDALLQSYNHELQGLGGLAQLPNNDSAIAQGMSNIGQTQAQGTIAQANTQSGATNNVFGTLLGLGSIGAQAGLFSDMRLKKNIRYSRRVGGHGWYKWDWNEAANELGLEGSGQGVIAHHVFDTQPEAIEISPEGYLKVRYDLLREVA